MNEASGSKKMLSLICLIGGVVLLIWSLALDFMGTKAGYRGALLVIGIIGIIVGIVSLATGAAASSSYTYHSSYY